MDSDKAMGLSHHHRDTLERIFEHPVSNNIDWTKAVALLRALGAIDERPDGRLGVTLGSDTEVFDRPTDKDLSVEQVVDLRRMLANAGFAPRR